MFLVPLRAIFCWARKSIRTHCTNWRIRAFLSSLSLVNTHINHPANWPLGRIWRLARVCLSGTPLLTEAR
jgi:hypothetical protein